jgi:hypothetical protein
MVRRIKRSGGMLSCALGLGAMFAIAAPASAVNIFEDNTSPITVEGITGYATTGADMAGMQVTAYFLGGAFETITWVSLGGGAGQAAGTGWTLSATGDTFGSIADPYVGLWDMSVSSPNVFIDRLLISGINPQLPQRGVVFDRTEPFFGTEGSFRGRDFSVYFIATTIGLDPGFDDLNVTYLMPVESLSDGSGIVGDLFAQMLIEPIRTSGTAPSAGYFYQANQLGFYADTDTIGMYDPGSADPGRQEFPEPGALSLLAIGACMLVRRSARRPV